MPPVSTGTNYAGNCTASLPSLECWLVSQVVAKVKCVGCEQLQSVKKLNGHDGFAECPQCRALFDVTSDVVKRAPRGGAEFWSHGNIPQPSDVGVLVTGAEKSKLAAQPEPRYRGNARVDAGEAALLLTYKDEKLFTLRLVGMILLPPLLGCAYFLRVLGPVEPTILLISLVVLGIPTFVAVYAAAVGFVNKWRIQVDRSSLHIDLGPLRYPHKKVDLRVTNIARVVCYYDTQVLRGGVKKTLYELYAWSPSGRRESLVVGLRSAETAMFLQQRLATFLGLDSSAPVPLTNTNVNKDNASMRMSDDESS